MPAEPDADLPPDTLMDRRAVQVALIAQAMHHTLLGVRLRQKAESNRLDAMTVADFDALLQREDDDVAATLFPPKR